MNTYLPAFNGQNIFLQVMDCENRFVFLNDYFDKQNALMNDSNIHGLTYEMFADKNELFSNKYYKQIEALNQQVRNNGQIKSFFATTQHINGDEYTRQATIFPIFDSDEVVIGTYTLSWYANPFNCLNHSQQVSIESHQLGLTNINKLGLTKQEHEVLFLLLYKFSQYEIAEYLNVSRGRIQKIISEGLYRKFGENCNNTHTLLSLAKKLNLHNYFPPALISPDLVILNNSNLNFQQLIAN